MKKNILIIGNFPPPYGGVPHHIERLVEYLTDNKWDCHVLSAGTTGNETKGALHIYKPTYLRKILALFFQLTNTQFKKWRAGGNLNSDSSGFWIRYKMYADVGSQIIRKNDIQLIVAYNSLTYGPVGAYLAKRFNLPLIINIFGEAYKFQVMRNNKNFFQKVLAESDVLLACSKHCGDSIRLLGCDRNVETVTYGVNTQHFYPGDSVNLRTRLDIGTAPVILFVGRIDNEMGTDTFLALAQALIPKYPTARFIIVGQAGDLIKVVLETCEVSNGRIQVIENVSYNDLADFYRLASVVVVPTRGDRTCSSLAAMEAMATRKAVVAFAIGGIPEIIVHEKNGLLVTPEDTSALTTAVERLLTDNVLRTGLEDAGYEMAQNYFYERRVSEIMERHYISLINKS